MLVAVPVLRRAAGCALSRPSVFLSTPASSAELARGPWLAGASRVRPVEHRLASRVGRHPATRLLSRMRLGCGPVCGELAGHNAVWEELQRRAAMIAASRSPVAPDWEEQPESSRSADWKATSSWTSSAGPAAYHRPSHSRGRCGTAMGVSPASPGSGGTVVWTVAVRAMVARAGLVRAHGPGGGAGGRGGRGGGGFGLGLGGWANFTAEFRMGSPMTDDRMALPRIV